MKEHPALLFILALLPIFFTPFSLMAEEYNSEGEFTYIKGDCWVRESSEDQYKKVQVGQTVHSSSLVKTSHDSEAEITFQDHNVLFIAEDSEIQLHRSLLRDRDYTSIGLLIGRIKVVFERLIPERSEFSINTVTVIAGIRGTIFEVAVRDDGAVLVSVEEGKVETKFEDKSHTISQGQASSFLLSGEREDYTTPVDFKSWRAKALERLKENPEQFFKRLLMRERLIIERLKSDRKRLESYRKEWDNFLRRISTLERQGRYREELQLIEKQIQRTKAIMIYLSITRRNLAMIRSIFMLTARIEQRLTSETAQKLPSLQELRREFVRVSVIIKSINKAEQRFQRVLFVLNREYDEVQKMAK